MLLYLTIGILFTYTLLLIGFFMGWCSMIPTKCHPRKGIPFSAVKSPRRNTKFVEISSVSASHSAESLKHMLPARKYSRCLKKHSLSIAVPTVPQRQNDYLHPKYSLPPVTIDAATRWEFERLLRAKAAALAARTPSAPSDSESSTVSLIEEQRPAAQPATVAVANHLAQEIFVV